MTCIGAPMVIAGMCANLKHKSLSKFVIACTLSSLNVLAIIKFMFNFRALKYQLVEES